MHCVLDLETWGTKPGCAIRSVGACTFDPKTGLIYGTFYRNVADASCKAWGLKWDPSTEQFWADQGEEAQAALLVDQKPLPEVLADFNAWWGEASCEFLYGMGANFDPPILEAAYDACDIEWPWKFWNVRCARTILALGNRRPERVGREVAHHALDDAKAEARAIAAVFQHGLFTPG